MPFQTVKEEKLEESPATNPNSATPSASTDQLEVIPPDEILGIASHLLQPNDEP